MKVIPKVEGLFPGKGQRQEDLALANPEMDEETLFLALTLMLQKGEAVSHLHMGEEYYFLSASTEGSEGKMNSVEPPKKDEGKPAKHLRLSGLFCGKGQRIEDLEVANQALTKIEILVILRQMIFAKQVVTFPYQGEEFYLLLE